MIEIFPRSDPAVVGLGLETETALKIFRVCLRGMRVDPPCQVENLCICILAREFVEIDNIVVNIVHRDTTERDDIRKRNDSDAASLRSMSQAPLSRL